MAKQQTCLFELCVQNRIAYTVPRTHPQETNIPQHRGCGEICLSHMEKGVEKGDDAKTEPIPQAILWQLRNPHIPQRTNPNNIHNQQMKKYSTTNSKPQQTPNQKQTPKQRQTH